jgi:GNAT superfamily N-acetyltransferase
LSKEAKADLIESLRIRPALRADLLDIVRMLADDDLGSQREHYEIPLPDVYLAAFDQIENSSFFELIAAELDGSVVGTLQLIFIPSISYQGGLRAQVESVRVDAPLRGRGIGEKMMQYAIERARQRGAHLMQLTTHNTRTGAHRFYERLGFIGSHLGMKISLK